jgi:hypothetical protein
MSIVVNRIVIYRAHLEISENNQASEELGEGWQ